MFKSECAALVLMLLEMHMIMFLQQEHSDIEQVEPIKNLIKLTNCYVI